MAHTRYLVMLVCLLVLGGLSFGILRYLNQQIAGPPIENAMEIETELEDYLGKELDDLCVVSASFNNYIIGDEEEGKQYHILRNSKGELVEPRGAILANETTRLVPGERIDSTLTVIDGELERTDLNFNGYFSDENISLTSTYGEKVEEYRFAVNENVEISVNDYDVKIEVLESDPENNVLTANLSKNVCTMH